MCCAWLSRWFRMGFVSEDWRDMWTKLPAGLRESERLRNFYLPQQQRQKQGEHDERLLLTKCVMRSALI